MPDFTTLTLPRSLRDLIASHRQHPSQAYHEVVAEALAAWLQHGGWGCAPCERAMASRVRRPVPARRQRKRRAPRIA